MWFQGPPPPDPKTANPFGMSSTEAAPRYWSTVTAQPSHPVKGQRFPFHNWDSGALFIYTDSLTWKWKIAPGKTAFLYEQGAFMLVSRSAVVLP